VYPSQYGAKNMKLVVRNLARTTTEAELKALFEAHGKVQSCTLVIDKKTGVSKGFGFVEMPRAGEAKAAMISINGTDLSGSKLRVKKAAPKPDEVIKTP
jgi:RNA recognition motif-containing protein